MGPSHTRVELIGARWRIYTPVNWLLIGSADGSSCVPMLPNYQVDFPNNLGWNMDPSTENPIQECVFENVVWNSLISFVPQYTDMGE